MPKKYVIQKIWFDRRKLLFLLVLSGFSLRIRTARPVHKPFVLERPLSLARLPTISDARGDPRRQTVWNNAPHSRCTPEPPPFCFFRDVILSLCL